MGLFSAIVSCRPSQLFWTIPTFYVYSLVPAVVTLTLIQCPVRDVKVKLKGALAPVVLVPLSSDFVVCALGRSLYCDCQWQAPALVCRQCPSPWSYFAFVT